MVTSAELDRLQRLAYRERLREAEAAGDHEFIESELRRNQLTEEDLRRLQRHHTRLEDWPDTPDDLLEPEDAPPPGANDTTPKAP